MRRVAALLVLPALAIGGCGPSESEEPRVVDPTPSTSAPAAPPSDAPPGMPVPDGPVVARWSTVLDDGDGAELCLGGIAESLPPQCGGPELVGWDWSEHRGRFEQAAGTRWGEFSVTGTFDGVRFTPSEAGPVVDVPLDVPGDSEFETPCTESPDGWVVDPNRVSLDDYQRAHAAAGRLDDYATSWVDTSLDRRSPEETDQDFAAGDEDASLWIVNVQVTRDVARAKAAIREVWGGGICVTTAEHTDAELRRIQRQIDRVPGFLSSGGGMGHVELTVIYDDGTIQARMYERFGPGLVLVTSALEDVDE